MLCIPSQIFTMFDTPKENDSSKGIEQHHEEHAVNNEEGLHHGDQHSQH